MRRDAHHAGAPAFYVVCPGHLFRDCLDL